MLLQSSIKIPSMPNSTKVTKVIAVTVEASELYLKDIIYSSLKIKAMATHLYQTKWWIQQIKADTKKLFGI